MKLHLLQRRCALRTDTCFIRLLTDVKMAVVRKQGKADPRLEAEKPSNGKFDKQNCTEATKHCGFLAHLCVQMLNLSLKFATQERIILG